jgi:nickel/cobalt exporter
MTTILRVLCCLPLAAGLFAHPMGNFSVNHYSRLDVTSIGVHLTYVLDLAEIPTVELFQEWQISDKNAGEFQAKAAAQAASLLANVIVDTDGHRIQPRLGRVTASLFEGAGGMPTAHIVINADLRAGPGRVSYEDRNYADRTGWKEIVIRGGDGVSLISATRTDADLSHELTIYPADLSLAPPQDLRASVSWAIASLPPEAPAIAAPKRAIPASQQPAALERVVLPATVYQPVSRPFTPPQQGSGAVKAGDFLSRMLRDKRFGIGSILLGLLVAFGLGAMHALSPGHGKTIVAAYLIGSRGTLKHALFLGSTVTFTHTVSVFLLGLGVLLFQQYVVPERAIPVIGAISGISIICVGAWLLYKRSIALIESGASADHPHYAGEQHHHDHEHHQGHERHNSIQESLGSSRGFRPTSADAGVAVLDVHQAHSHAHDHADMHTHSEVSGQVEEQQHPHSHGHNEAFVHTHRHDGHTHAHVVPEGPMALGGLVALGVSGGMVPCPSALILLLSAIALGHTALGLMLLLAFSAGLAMVLMAIGALVLYAKHMLPDARLAQRHPFFRLVPVFSAVVVVVMGLLMTMTALGLIQPVRYFS